MEVHSLEKNINGRDFVVGDIHGMYNLLDESLNQIEFNPQIDRLISVGDLINRGPQSVRSLEFLEKHWFHAIKGNHEANFLKEVDRKGSSKQTVAGTEWATYISNDMQEKLYKAFIDLPIAIEIETNIGNVGFIHAEVPKHQTWQEFKNKVSENDKDTITTALTSRKKIIDSANHDVEGITRIFCGHSTPDNALVEKLGNCYYIDTGAVYGYLGRKENQYSLTLTEIDLDEDHILNNKSAENLNIIFRP